MLVAALFALVLAAVLGRAAYVLPRALDADIPSEPTLAHRCYRTGFWIAGPVLAMLCAWRFGPTPAAGAAIIYIVVLLALAWVDAETGYLPDRLSLPLLWIGLLVNLNGAFTPLRDAVLGAAAGYLVLWIVFQYQS